MRVKESESKKKEKTRERESARGGGYTYKDFKSSRRYVSAFASTGKLAKLHVAWSETSHQCGMHGFSVLVSHVLDQ